MRRRGGLAAAGGADEDEELAVGDLEVERVDRGDGRSPGRCRVALSNVTVAMADQPLHRQVRAGRSVVKVVELPPHRCKRLRQYAVSAPRRGSPVPRTCGDGTARGVVRLRRVTEIRGQPGWPTSRPRPASARRRSAGCSTASRASPTRPGRRCSPRSTCSATTGRPGCGRKTARLVGLIVPELVNPIFPAFAQVIETALAADGLHAGAVHADPGRRARGRLRADAARPRRRRDHLRLSGLHADATSDPARYQALRERGLPIVLVNGYAGGHRRAVHLQRRRRVDGPRRQPPRRSSGHTEIGLAVGPERYTPGHPQDRRASGAAMREHLGVEPATSSGWSSTPCSASRAAPRRPAGSIDRGCTAVVCGSDLMALGAIRQARSMRA